MDAFYASVEQRDRPELRGRPVVVGGDPHGRGVVASASYEARRFGIRSAMSSAQAYRLCPKAEFVYPDFSRYREASDKIHAIFQEFSDLVEPLSLDEAYLDVTENKLGEKLASRIAALIKERIRAETGLTASAGVGPNKFIAKIASDMRKPDGLVVVSPDRVAQFVEKLPVEKLWGVGPATARTLHGLGIFTTADIRRTPLAELERELGKYAAFLHGLAHGQDDRPVDPGGEAKSRGSETTFERDVLDTHALEDSLREQAEEVAASLREMVRPGKTITLKVRYADFRTITRSKTLPIPTDDAALIARVASELLLSATDAGRVPVRLIGVSVSGLLDPEEPEQLWLAFRPAELLYARP